MYGNNVCALMNKSNTKSNNISNEKWKCNIILEMLDCLYVLRGETMPDLCCHNWNIYVIFNSFVLTASILRNLYCPFLLFVK